MRVLVAVPVFNEEPYVVRVLAEIRRYAGHVLVVDDGSTDATPAILSDLARRHDLVVLTHPENRGYGQSLIDAFAYAAAERYDWVLTMDCDEQHEPARIPDFIAACRRNNEPAPHAADIISGSRYLRTDQAADQPPPDRRSINHTITEMLNSVLSLQVFGAPTQGSIIGTQDAAAPQPGLTDSFCGFKAHRVAALQKLRLTIPGYAFPMQFWVQAAFAGLKVEELPVRLIYKDATRHFGGNLDDPTARLSHYLEVLAAELAGARQAKLGRGAAREDLTECSACCEE